MFTVQIILALIGMATGAILMFIALYNGNDIYEFLTEGERKSTHVMLIGIGLIGAGYFTMSALSLYGSIF